MVSEKYTVEITPAGWTFSTWIVIYLWQLLWIILNIVAIFKKTEFGLLYRTPQILTAVFHIIIFHNFSSNIAWLFAWDQEQISVILIII